MAGYRLFVKPSAAEELEAIGSRADRRRIVERIAALASDPRPRGCTKLAGHEDRFRIRQGSYRVVYRVDDTCREITVFKIGHRRDVYR